MHKNYIISMVAATSTGIAIWALIKLFKTEKKLQKLSDKYNDPKAVYRCLLNHYGSLELLPLLKPLISNKCEDFQSRFAEMCKNMCLKYKTPLKRILDIGSGTGGTAFHHSKVFKEVVGTDISYFMNITCEQLKENNETTGLFSNEGGCHITSFKATLPTGCHKERVTFWDEDACNLVFSCGIFDCVSIVNSLTELSNPKKFLKNISDYVKEGGLLILADTYCWPNGPEIDLNTRGTSKTFDILKILLSPKWDFKEQTNIPFYSVNSERSIEVGNSHLTVWKRKSELA